MSQTKVRTNNQKVCCQVTLKLPLSTVIVIVGSGKTHIYSSGKKQQTMLLCNVGHVTRRFREGLGTQPWLNSISCEVLFIPLHGCGINSPLCVGVFIRLGYFLNPLFYILYKVACRPATGTKSTQVTAVRLPFLCSGFLFFGPFFYFVAFPAVSLNSNG